MSAGGDVDRWVVRIETTKAVAARLERWCEEEGTDWTQWAEEDRDVVRFECCRKSRSGADAAGGRFLAALREVDPDGDWTAAVSPLPARDWAEAWKEHFHARRVSPRLIVRPSWEPVEAGPRDRVLVIDPGMSFGTGLHATTRACLRFLDEAAAARGGGSFLDAGCGSGILAIAAARLGLRPVVAIDVDPDAVRIATANGRVNGVDDAIAWRAGDAAALDAAGTFDIVAANILAEVLLDAAPAIAGCVAAHESARLLLAGVLDTQYAAVRDRYRALGFAEVASIREGEWRSGCFRPCPAGG